MTSAALTFDARRARKSSPSLAIVLVLVAAMLGVVVGRGAPRLLDTTGSGAAALHGSTVRPAGSNGGLAEKASHVLQPVAGRPGSFRVDDLRYRSSFDGSGFSYVPDGSTTGTSVALRSVGRSGGTTAVRAGSWRAVANVSTRRVAAGVTERVTARTGALEWDLLVRSAPAGEGDIVARADLAGALGPAQRTVGATGPQWRVPVDGGRFVTIGEVVVRDAHGRAVYRGLPAMTQHGIELRVPARVVDTAAYPLTVDPAVTDDVPMPAGGYQGSPSIAFSGTSYLVVWVDRESDGLHAVGSRVSSDGIVGASFDISGGQSIGQEPTVAWNGSSFFVVWQFQYAANDLDIVGRFVSAGGVLGAFTTVSDPTANQSMPAVVAAGSNFYVVWADQRVNGYDVYGARISSDGSRPDGQGIAIAFTSRDEVYPRVAWNGTSYLVAFQIGFFTGDDNVSAQLVTSSAQPTGSPIVLAGSTADQGQPGVASDGTNFLVVWQDATAGGFDILGQRISGGGAKLAGTIAVSAATGDQRIPVITFDQDYFVAWIDKRTSPQAVYGGRIATDGTRKDGDGFSVSGAATVNVYDLAASRGADTSWAIAFTRDIGGPGHVNLRTVTPK